MNKPLSENDLCSAAWEAIKERLGVAEAMRFLSLIRNAPRDYQTWRAQHFKNLTTDELIHGLKAAENPPQ